MTDNTLNTLLERELAALEQSMDQQAAAIINLHEHAGRRQMASLKTIERHHRDMRSTLRRVYEGLAADRARQAGVAGERPASAEVIALHPDRRPSLERQIGEPLTPGDCLREAAKLYLAATNNADPIWQQKVYVYQARFGRSVRVEITRALTLRVTDPQSGHILAESMPGTLTKLHRA